jgi:metal-dependent amidase/aminoacylase/carboxypeptidase family protein
LQTDKSNIQQWLSETRRDFHMHPEISHREKRTTKRIAEKVLAVGVDIFTEAVVRYLAKA